MTFPVEADVWLVDDTVIIVDDTVIIVHDRQQETEFVRVRGLCTVFTYN
jgi:hypothetical protein